MSERERLVAALNRAVDDGAIRRETADSILARYDAGDLALGQLPYFPDELSEQIDRETLLAGLTWAKSFTHRAMVVRFQKDARRFAQSALVGVAAFQARLLRESKIHLVAQHAKGSGATRLILPPELATLEAIAANEAGFVRRFGDSIFAKNLARDPPTIPQIAQRAELYAGPGVAEYWRSSENANYQGVGWVFDYLAKDDPATCGPCLEAMARGPYLAGQGPMPGEVCFGKGHCRCDRIPRQDAKAYARLTNG